jgi:NitT/TauT family transport system permease protein
VYDALFPIEPNVSVTKTNRVYLKLMWRSLAPTKNVQPSDVLWPIALFAAILFAWEGAVRTLAIPDIILPAPSAIAVYLLRRDALFFNHLWPTLIQTIEGFALAVVGGILLAILVSLTEIGRRGIMPLLVIAQIIPKIAVAPLLMLWFGLGDLSRVLIAFLVSFFPMVINTASGLESVSEEVTLLGRSLSRSRRQFFMKIQLPHALPYIFDGMKVSITLAIIGVIVAEFVSSQRGLGYLIMFANGRLDTVMMMAAITVLSVAGLLLYALIALLGRIVIYWGAATEV